MQMPLKAEAILTKLRESALLTTLRLLSLAVVVTSGILKERSGKLNTVHLETTGLCYSLLLTLAFLLYLCLRLFQRKFKLSMNMKMITKIKLCNLTSR